MDSTRVRIHVQRKLSATVPDLLEQSCTVADSLRSNRELQCSHLPSKYFTDFKKSSVSVGSSQLLGMRRTLKSTKL